MTTSAFAVRCAPAQAAAHVLAPRWLLVLLAVLGLAAAPALAQPSSVEHSPLAGAFSPVSGTSTQRSPGAPREGESVTIYFRVSFQFSYNEVAIYYTTDGTEPAGSFGTPAGTTQVLRGGGGGSAITFHANENSGGVRDWWRTTLPAPTRGLNTRVRYKVSAWRPFVGNEVFANGGAAYEFTNNLPWPGQGSAFGSGHPLGYPPVHFWKEEALVGNGSINAMIDRNGSWYDVIFPGAGGVFGVGTANEGYAGGLDTFPPFTAGRGQMHVNTAMVGLRVDAVTSWLSNATGADFTNLEQAYIAGTNVVRTAQRYVRGGRAIDVEQFDFAPEDIAFANGPGGAGNPLRSLVVKRMILTSREAAPIDVDVYLYLDPALNGGDGFDAMFDDPARGALVAFDNAGGSSLSRGEYNPRSDGIDYPKNVSVYLAGAIKTSGPPGAAAALATPAGSWRQSSGDNGQGWIGRRITLQPDVPYEVSFVLAGGFDNFALATGTYNVQQAPVIDAFLAQSVAAWQTATENWWRAWLSRGTSIDFPDDRYDRTFERGLLATALHIDRAGGGVVAGYHNGAYLYVWPRDAAWAGVTLARAGFFPEARRVADWLRDVTFRSVENWPDGPRKGFWKQKYTTDGHIVWFAAQVDETAVVPWLVNFVHDITGDDAFLAQNYPMSFDAGLAMTRTSLNEPARLNYQPAVKLMFSNNIWEDSNDTHLYSNANIWRGLLDLEAMAAKLNLPADLARWQGLTPTFAQGVRDRLDWNGENTDISQLGITYPFELIAPTDPRAARVADRINGVAPDRFGNFRPLVRFDTPANQANDWVGLLDRYAGDGYWNGGPWFLSTMWYGGFYGLRQDYLPGSDDIANHAYRVERTMDHLGPAGFGAEQMAPANSLLYPGQTDFTLQTAWPNAWESMSFYVDAMMLFLDYRPLADANLARVEPKIPAAWGRAAFRNVRMGDDATQPTLNHAFDYAIDETGPRAHVHTITNLTGHQFRLETFVRLPADAEFCSVVTEGFTNIEAVQWDAAIKRVRVQGTVGPGAGSVAKVSAFKRPVADFNLDGVANDDDLGEFITAYFEIFPGPGGYSVGPCAGVDAPYDTAGYAADFNGDCSLNDDDLGGYITAYFAGCE